MRPVAESGELAQSQTCGAWRRATYCVPPQAADRVRLFADFSFPAIRARMHPAIRIARISGRAPGDWQARKAGDCSGFSPPFT